MLKIFLALFLQVQIASATVVKVGYSPVLSSAGIFIAMERGYFKEFGLEVQGTPFRSSSAPMNALLAKGELDVGGGNVTSGLWNANGENEQIKLVADKGTVSKGHDYLALLVRSDLVKEGKFKTLKDLKGLKVAFTALNGTSQEIAMSRFLQKAGLSPKDVTYLKMPYSDMNAAFRTKALDATIQLEPYISQAVEEGIAVNFASVYSVYPDQPSAVLFYSGLFAKNRKEEAVKFMAAYLRGVRDYIDAFGRGSSKSRKDIVEILKKYCEPLPDSIWEKMAPVGLNPDGYLDTKNLNSDLEWFKKMKYVEKPLSVEGHVDHSFVEAALKMIGKYKKGKN
jgi:NitT/TauT family transport system substrate-binding protein